MTGASSQREPPAAWGNVPTAEAHFRVIPAGSSDMSSRHTVTRCSDCDEQSSYGPTFELAVVRQVEVCLIELTGEVDMANAEALGERLVQLSDQTVVVDLSGLSFIDSSGIAALIVARNQAKANGHKLVLTRPQSNVRRVFGFTGLPRRGARRG